MISLKKVDIYPVITEEFCGGRDRIEVLKGVIQGGAKMVQLREKRISKKELYSVATHFRKITADAGVLLIINDHIDIAAAVEADGVHLGQDDLPIDIARKLQPDMIIGTSTHNIAQAISAEKSGASYINIGPIFHTNTKKTAVKPLGIHDFVHIKSHVSIPFTVMGGISLDNVDLLIKNDARMIAVVTAVTLAPDIAEAVRRFRDKIQTITV